MPSFCSNLPADWASRPHLSCGHVLYLSRTTRDWNLASQDLQPGSQLMLPHPTTPPPLDSSRLAQPVGPEGFKDPKWVAGCACLQGLGHGVKGTEVLALSHTGPLQAHPQKAAPPPPFH